MQTAEILVLLLATVAALGVLARRWQIPDPIVLVVGGLAISFIPSLPKIALQPELVFLIFMPPLLYAQAWLTSWRDFRDNLRPISMLAVGLVLFSTVVVGYGVHALIPGVPLVAAMVLGAIVSPPDAVAASAIAHKVGLPKRVVTILEGESLVNDATGLVAYQFAVAAVLTGTFSFSHALGKFFLVAAGGIAVGLTAGVIITWVHRKLEDDAVQITFSLLAPYLAYLPAEHLQVSGVLAAVSAGIYSSQFGSEILSPAVRIQSGAVWGTMIFLLNGAIFILIGLQLPASLQGLAIYSLPKLLGYAVFTSLLVMIARPVWIFPAAYLPRQLSRRIRERDPLPAWQNVAVISWSGMRGVVSLAAAMALPQLLDNGQEFPARNLIIFLAFCVILTTLVLQGLSLPWVIRRLRIKPDAVDGSEERAARLRVAHAAIARIEELAMQGNVPERVVNDLTAEYDERIHHLNDVLAEGLGWSSRRQCALADLKLRREVLQAERKMLLQLQRERQIGDDILHKIEHELDLEETRTGPRRHLF